jgi:hypothetical protein
MTGSLRNSIAYLRTTLATYILHGVDLVKVQPSEETIKKIKEYARKIQKDGVGSSCTDKSASE